MFGCVRTSTFWLYQVKWMPCCGWCCGRGVAPVNATVSMIVDFLVHLHRDKRLSVSAVKGYRSALNSVLALKGMDLADSSLISMLIRSFSKSVRPEELAQKTLFLLTLASAKRIGELHALSHRISHSRD